MQDLKEARDVIGTSARTAIEPAPADVSPEDVQLVSQRQVVSGQRGTRSDQVSDHRSEKGEHREQRMADPPLPGG